MDVLVIGGTRFVGRHLTDSLLAAGHTPTLFHRGESGTDLFPNVARIHGDRRTDIAKAAERSWDAVVDTCGYLPEELEESLTALDGKYGRYLFVSTISVYEGKGPNREEMPLKEPVSGIDKVTNETYGGLKVACETQVGVHARDKATVVRPGVIVGPYDPTDRFTYWPVRALEGGTIVRPGRNTGQTTAIDGRDLAAFMVKLLEDDRAGIFNGDNDGMTLDDIIDACRELEPSGTTHVTLTGDEIDKSGVQPWSELPLWTDGDTLCGDARRSVDEGGLILRPIVETVRDTAEWVKAEGKKRPLATGMSLEREEEVLSACGY